MRPADKELTQAVRAAQDSRCRGQARIYDRLELRLTYKPAEGLIHV
jgi:hypothetical protein